MMDGLKQLMLDHLDLIVVIVKTGIVFTGLLLSIPVLVLVERKLLGRIQERPGPNRVGLYMLFKDVTGRDPGRITKLALGWFRNGELQTIVDGIKLMIKEDLVPPKAEKPIFLLAPLLVLVPAFLAFAIVPFGPEFSLAVGETVQTVQLGLTDLDVGILFYLAVTGVGVYGIVLAGWASNSKYSLLGGMRSTAQLVSYELGLGLSIIGVLLIVGSFNMRELTEHQAGSILNWHIWQQPLGFLLFLMAGFGETNRLPFDLPEGETELGAGFHTEYSSIKFAMFFMAEYVNILTFSAIMTALFLGGYHDPFGIIDRLSQGWAALWGVGWFLAKVGVLFGFFVLVRGTLPRLRYDQLMALGWKVMFPAAVANVMLTAAILTFDLPRGWTTLLLFLGGMALIYILDRIDRTIKKRAVGYAA